MITRIVYLQIENFKSLDKVQLTNLSPFSVFAGPNGSGKSNLLEALRFLGLVARQGVSQAIDACGGVDSIRCRLNEDDFIHFKLRFETEIKENQTFHKRHYAYMLALSNLNGELQITEKLEAPLQFTEPDGTRLPSTQVIAFRNKGEDKVFFAPFDDEHEFTSFNGEYEAVSLNQNTSLLLIKPYTRFSASVMSNIFHFHLSPQIARQPGVDKSTTRHLLEDGSNLASIVKQQLADAQRQTEILDWMSLVVPSLENIQVIKNDLDKQLYLQFNEKQLAGPLPANLMSDGTMQLLALLMAIYSVPEHGWSLIEEPENGLHPKALQELTTLMREQGNTHHPIWLTTHDTYLVNQLQADELWLVDKVDGRTRFVRASDLDLTNIDMTMGELWLSNAFGAGLPW